MRLAPQAVSARGRAILAALDATNAARQGVGLEPIWPADDAPQAVDASEGQPRHMGWNVTNSTDYFKWLFDESHLASAEWNPQISDFDYTRLAGAGVGACTNGHLTSAHNLWTVVKNLHADMPGTTPVLVSRNVDAASLAAKVTEADLDKRLAFSSEWHVPFANVFFVVIRKDGTVTCGTHEEMSYRVFYAGKPFDATVDRQGKPYATPLKYVTPSREVLPTGPKP